MNIHPMDMQVLIPRTTDVSKVQQLANQQVAAEQQVFGEQLKKVAEQRERQVQHLPQAEGEKITANKEKQQQHKHKQQQDASAQEPSSDEPPTATRMNVLNRPSQNDPVRGHSIDIIT